MPVEYDIRTATIGDLAGLVSLQTNVRSLAVKRRELPAVDLVNAIDAETRLTQTINDGNRVILIACVGGNIKGKGHLNFYPDRGTLTLSSFEVDPQLEGLGVAVEFCKTGINMAKERYPQIQTLRMGRYNRSEDYRKRGNGRKTFFDFVAEQSGVEVKTDEWEGEQMKWYNIPFPTAEWLIIWYEKLHNRFPII